MIYVIILLWIICALLTLKLDAVLTGTPTNYKEDWLLALLFWWFVAYIILTSKHECNDYFSNDKIKDSEFHY